MILVADNSSIAREFLAKLAEEITPNELVLKCGDGKTAWKLYKEEKPRLLIVDLIIPEISGLDLIKRIKDSSRSARICVVTEEFNESTIMGIHRLKVDGVFDKSWDDCVNLRTAISIILQGGSYRSPTFQKILQKTLTSGERLDLILSKKEIEVFEYMGQGKTDAEIAEISGQSALTIKWFRKKIRSKLNVKNNQTLILEARKRGIWMYKFGKLNLKAPFNPFLGSKVRNPSLNQES